MSKTYYYDNPVGRFYKIIEKLKNTKNDTNVATCLNKFFGITENSQTKLFESIQETMNLFNSAKEYLNSTEIDADLYVPVMTVFERYLWNIFSRLNESASIIAAGISETGLETLRQMSFTASTIKKEKYIPKDKLDEIMKMVIELKDFIENNKEISDLLKKYLIDHLLKMEKDIVLYQLFGKEFAENAFKDMTFGYSIYREEFEANNGLKNKIMPYIKNLNEIIKLYTNYLVIAPKIATFVQTLIK